MPRLRQIEERALTGPCGSGKETTQEAQNRGRGYGGVAGLARSGPVAARVSLMSIFAQDLGQVFARERGMPFLDGVFPARNGKPESPSATSPSQGIDVTSFEWARISTTA